MILGMGKTALAIPATLLGAVVLLALAYSPVTCSCVDPATALALQAGMGRPDAPVDLDPDRLEAGLNRSLQGQPVVFGEYPYSREDGCVRADAETIVCRVPIDDSVLMAREFKVTYRLRQGRFQQADVDLVRWP